MSEHDLTGAYALDALGDEERDRFERHLEECGACRREVEELRRTAARLGSVEHASPSPHLRRRVLTAIESMPQDDAADPRPVRPGWRRWWLAAAAALLVGVIAIGVAVGLSRGGADAVMHEVMASADARMVELSGTAGGSARFLYAPSQQRGVLVATDVPAVAEDEAYQVWLIGPAGELPAGLFRPDQGEATLVVEGDLASARLMGVTVEPRGGAATPTGEVLYLAELNAAA